MTRTALVAFLTACLSWLAAFGSRRLASVAGAIDQPIGGRKIHTQPVPLLGGIGVGATVVMVVAIGWASGWFVGKDIRQEQLLGFLAALLLLMLVGFIDDRRSVHPWIRLGCYIAAGLIVLASGTAITQVTRIGGGAIPLPVWLGQPLTLVWLLAVTFAVKIMDGLDGLVTGLTVIGAGLIAALAFSSAYFQPVIAFLAIIVGASFLGFLPSNLHPARQFLGEAGSTIAGFSLAFLAVVSGAKVATAFMALGLPLVDASLVVFGRLARGVSPFQGDQTHLHFKLLQAGLTHRQVVAIMWFIALAFGVAALGLQTRGKIFLVLLLVAVTAALSVFAGSRRTSA